MSQTNRIVGEILRDARRRKGMTQEDLAEKANVHRNHISFLERGLRSPTLETLIQVCKALGVRASEVVADVERQLPE